MIPAPRRASPAALLLLGACALLPGSPGRAPRPAALERSYLEWRHLDDRRRLLGSLGEDSLPGGETRQRITNLAVLLHDELASGVEAALASRPAPPDSLALIAMRETLADARAPAESGEQVPCDGPAGPGGSVTLGGLTAATMACYQQAASFIIVGQDTLDRLAILGLLPRTPDPARREQLFRALDPVWRSINGGNEPASPYRQLVRLRWGAWGDTASPVEAKARAWGLTTDAFERWLAVALGRYRRLLPDTLVEPWDWYYLAGEASRRLSPRVAGRPGLRAVNDAYYRAIGADPALLRIHYDLAPRAGKYPVAFTDFGGRAPVEPWVFASYLDGGFDNLAELLHETGHAVHLAAIRTRPAYLDWPDNDTFTEALADVPALELYEPAWQLRFLGDSASLAASLRARYAGIALDMTWSLFEIAMHRDPSRDPDRLWAVLTERHLGIRPHPELSWWAMRGQLIDAPGYLLNYALGAFMAADIRARIGELDRSFTATGPGLYAWLGERLYRHGRERPASAVLAEFLGRPLAPDALLADLGRIRP